MPFNFLRSSFNNEADIQRRKHIVSNPLFIVIGISEFNTDKDLSSVALYIRVSLFGSWGVIALFYCMHTIF